MKQNSDSTEKLNNEGGWTYIVKQIGSETFSWIGGPFFFFFTAKIFQATLHVTLLVSVSKPRHLFALSIVKHYASVYVYLEVLLAPELYKEGRKSCDGSFLGNSTTLFFLVQVARNEARKLCRKLAVLTYRWDTSFWKIL